MITPTFSGQFYRDVSWEVEPIRFPIDLYLPVVLVLIASPTAKASWRVAGELVQVFGLLGELDIEGGATTMPLNNWKLINFPGVEEQEYYSLKFYPKPWIDFIEVQIKQSM
ncbi:MULTISPECIES: hypothetical protein [unclassified Microcoleus]|uniref:hypothetical protein n=1 Tax=unclassified Microcoleus TaxID=2642155 RepID=UPI002FD1F650